MSSKEFKKFDKTMEHLLKVPHSKIKEELEAEKAAKKQTPKKRGKKNG